ncbi:hypothetical protein [Catenuloplanes japonicus]|nr:hypothetical protein [Catenuloplanes japonicus]
MTTEAAALPAEDVVAGWVARYEHTWRTNDPADITALFTGDAECRGTR